MIIRLCWPSVVLEHETLIPTVQFGGRGNVIVDARTSRFQGPHLLFLLLLLPCYASHTAVFKWYSLQARFYFKSSWLIFLNFIVRNPVFNVWSLKRSLTSRPTTIVEFLMEYHIIKRVSEVFFCIRLRRSALQMTLL